MAKKARVTSLILGMVLALSLTLLPGTSYAGGRFSTGLSGTVNCNGSVTQYGATRYLTGYSTTDVYLSSAAYYSSWWYGTTTAMMLGVHINKTGTNIDQWVSGADRWATFDTTPYLPNTAFVMRAAMAVGHGTCSNSWSGTLYY